MDTKRKEHACCRDEKTIKLITEEEWKNIEDQRLARGEGRRQSRWVCIGRGDVYIPTEGGDSLIMRAKG